MTIAQVEEELDKGSILRLCDAIYTKVGEQVYWKSASKYGTEPKWRLNYGWNYEQRKMDLGEKWKILRVSE